MLLESWESQRWFDRVRWGKQFSEPWFRCLWTISLTSWIRPGWFGFVDFFTYQTYHKSHSDWLHFDHLQLHIHIEYLPLYDLQPEARGFHSLGTPLEGQRQRQISPRDELWTSRSCALSPVLVSSWALAVLVGDQTCPHHGYLGKLTSLQLSKSSSAPCTLQIGGLLVPCR